MSGTRKLLVIGQGYVGLPLSDCAVGAGYDVVGLDLDLDRIEQLNRGISYVEDIASERIREMLDSGRYHPSSDYADCAGFDVAVITVPTPLREGLPDLSYIEFSGRDLAPHIRNGSIVILESTTYPGTTEELLAPILDIGSGLSAGTDYHLGYSPERIDPGNAEFNFKNTPKVVAGVNERSLAQIQDFYSTLIDQPVPVSSCKVAELTKLLENTFRHVNIALVNELAMFAHDLGIDVWEAIDASTTKPFGYMRFTPGPGVGGHCLPIDPSYLLWDVKRRLGLTFRFVELANDVNNHMPDYVVTRCVAALNEIRLSVKDSRVLLIGLAYKKNTSDARESPAVTVAERLLDMGANLRAVDPHVVHTHSLRNIPRAELTPSEVADADLVLVLTDHDVLDWSLLRSASLVLDTRRVARENFTLL